MNCKPGDLAVVRAGCGFYTDKLVEVMRPYGIVAQQPREGHCWWCKPIGFTPPDCDLTIGGLFLFPDQRLKPIRDPGDDAQDESLSWLPVPTTEGVPA